MEAEEAEKKRKHEEKTCEEAEKQRKHEAGEAQKLRDHEAKKWDHDKDVKKKTHTQRKSRTTEDSSEG